MISSGGKRYESLITDGKVDVKLMSSVSQQKFNELYIRCFNSFSIQRAYNRRSSSVYLLVDVDKPHRRGESKMVHMRNGLDLSPVQLSYSNTYATVVFLCTSHLFVCPVSTIQ